MEPELITEHQAGVLMLLVLVAAPLAGLAWGLAAKRVRLGLGLGSAVGAGNYALWTAYNAVTDRLGLDTVKNLLVNLALFVVVGAAVGLGASRFAARAQKEKT